MNKPILLSTPHIGDRELEFVKEAFATNWIAPVGPHVDAQLIGLHLLAPMLMLSSKNFVK